MKSLIFHDLDKGKLPVVDYTFDVSRLWPEDPLPS